MNRPSFVPSDAPSPPPKIKSIQEIEDSTPRSPYSVVVSVMIGEDGVPTNINLIRSLGPEFNRTAIDAVRRSQFKPPVLNGTPVPVSAQWISDSRFATF